MFRVFDGIVNECKNVVKGSSTSRPSKVLPSSSETEGLKYTVAEMINVGGKKNCVKFK